MHPKKNLVITAVRGYDFEQLRPFVVSLKRTSFDGELVLLWNDLKIETREKLEEFGVKLVHFSYRSSCGMLNSWSRFWPYLAPLVRFSPSSKFSRIILKSIAHLLYVRFFYYHDFIATHPNKYQMCF